MAQTTNLKYCFIFKDSSFIAVFKFQIIYSLACITLNMLKHGLQRRRVFGQKDVHAIGTQVVDHQCKYLPVASFMSLMESDSPIYFSEHTGLISSFKSMYLEHSM